MRQNVCIITLMNFHFQQLSKENAMFFQRRLAVDVLFVGIGNLIKIIPNLFLCTYIGYIRVCKLRSGFNEIVGMG